MGLSDLDPASRERRPWNAGGIVGTKRPFKPRDVWQVDEVHGGIGCDLAAALPNGSARALSAKIHLKLRIAAAQRSRLFKASSPKTRVGLSGPARFFEIYYTRLGQQRLTAETISG